MLLKVVAGLISEIVLCIKEVNQKTRAAAYEVYWALQTSDPRTAANKASLLQPSISHHVMQQAGQAQFTALCPSGL